MAGRRKKRKKKAPREQKDPKLGKRKRGGQPDSVPANTVVDVLPDLKRMQVRLNVTPPSKRIAMQPEDARTLGKLLIRNADVIDANKRLEEKNPPDESQEETAEIEEIEA